MKTIYKKLLFLLLFLPFSVLAQGTLGGTVLDSKSNQPIPGVNVVIQGATNGTSTDFDGKFKLTKIKKGAKIVFSFIGYKNSVVTYDSQTSLTVSLVEESNQLQEVVVQVGYGSVKKKDATGSVALITSKDFNRGAILSTDQLLAGKAAGVTITNGGGAPDSSPTIRIRGGASLNASNDPLIIIDGVPISDGGTNPWTLINPSDVESFSVLKDASATAIYGVRASNGVILITTKKGTSGAPQFNYSANISIGQVGKKLDVMNAADFTKFIQQQAADPRPNNPYKGKTNLLGVDDPTTNAVDDPSTPQIEGRILSDTDWYKQIVRTSVSTDHNFSARANLYKKIPFRASLGYTNVEGILKGSKYERISYSFKMTPKLLHDDLKIDINAKGNFSKKNNVDEGAIGAALSMDPTKPVFAPSENNKFVGYYQQTSLSGNRDVITGPINPLALLEQRTAIDRAVRFLGNVEFDYKLPFLRDLRAIVNLGLDASQRSYRETFDNNALATYTFNQGTDPTSNYLFNPGLAGLYNATATNKTMDTYLTYAKTLTGFVTRVDGQAGYSYQDFKTDGYGPSFRNNVDTGIREQYISNPNNPNNREFRHRNLQAFFARGNFDILSRYLFTATLRADATSVFAPNKRWGYFPAVGAAWKLKEESFLKESNLIQDLKLRLGWGKTGQATLPGSTIEKEYFPYLPTYVPGDAQSQYLPGATTYTIGDYDANLTWEKTTTINFGLDFELFKNSILSGSVDVYKRKTNDLLAVVPLSAGATGGTEFLQNIGSLSGEGVEVSLNVKAIKTVNFALGFSGNIAYNYNTISDLKGKTFTSAGGSIGGTGNSIARNPVGYQPYSAFVYEQIYDASGQPIVGAYKDLNNDGVINDSDKHYVALRANWTYGFSTNLSYKRFDLTANFRGQLGGQVYNLQKHDRGYLDAAIPSQSSQVLQNVLNFYNGSANPLFYNYLGNAELSDYMLEDATFLRCDNISLGYKVLKFIDKSSLRVSASVNNAFLITSYSGQDPENYGAIDGNFYPRPRTYTFGVSLDF
jgi:iron complex outermembrane receptor protein